MYLDWVVVHIHLECQCLKKFGFLVGRDTAIHCASIYLLVLQVYTSAPLSSKVLLWLLVFLDPRYCVYGERVKLVLCCEAAIARASSSRECQCMHLANSYIRHITTVYIYILWILCAAFSWSARKITTASIRKVHFKLVAVAIILTLCACECECEFCVAYLCLSDLAYRSAAGL